VPRERSLLSGRPTTWALPRFRSRAPDAGRSSRGWAQRPCRCWRRARR
jgi:hypothetical protein